MSSNLPSTPPTDPLGVTNPGSIPNDNEQMAARLTALENRFPISSWLYGPNFFKRALAMWGHVIVVQIVISIVIWLVVFGCVALFAGGFAAFGRR